MLAEVARGRAGEPRTGNVLETRSVLFIDSNVAMYLVGAAHPNKPIAGEQLGDAIVRGERLVTDAEVFREILHRSQAIRRPAAVEPACNLLTRVVDEVFPIEHADVRQARVLLGASPGLSARETVHAAVMRRRGVGRLLSFDSGFDRLGGLARVGRSTP